MDTGKKNGVVSPHYSIPLKEHSLSLLTVVVILGGILAGIFTPTEAAIIATFLRNLPWILLPHTDIKKAACSIKGSQ